MGNKITLFRARKKNSKIKSVKTAQVIITESSIGKGIESDPIRILVEYWDLTGGLLAQHDTINDSD